MSEQKPPVAADDTVQMEEVIVNDAVIAEAGRVVRVLVDLHGLGGAIARLVSATEQALEHVLHLESPLWEQNVAGIEKICTVMTENVMKHRSCAQRINQEGDDARLVH